MEVSDHIKKAAGSVRLFGEVRSIQILGIPHKALKAYAGAAGSLVGSDTEYVVSVIKGYWCWSSCTCDGYRYTSCCKHIYKANQYLDKMEKGEK